MKEQKKNDENLPSWAIKLEEKIKELEEKEESKKVKENGKDKITSY